MNKFFMLTILFLSACQSDQPTNAMPSINSVPAPPTAPVEVPEPPFVQEGVLELRSSSNATLTLLRLNIEIAHEEQECNQGLMWRKKMGENEGMLFVFDYSTPQSFWMRNTYIPLDIIYVNENFEVVTVLKNVPVLNDAPRPSLKPAKYVIEVNAGVADKYGIMPGAQVAWSDYVSGQSMGKTTVSGY